MTDRRLWVVAALLALAGIALNIVFWITRQRTNVETFEGPPRSDYTLGNFTLNALDGEGKLSFQTVGPFLARRGEDGSIFVTTPDYVIYDGGGHQWKGKSESAWVNKEGTVMKLLGHAMAGARQYGWSHTQTAKSLGDLLAALALGTFTVQWEVTSNAFVKVPDGPTINIAGGTLTAADYNAFDNAQTGNYSDGRQPAHDKIGDAKLAMPGMGFGLDDAVIWTGGTKVSGILGIYRTRYTPQAGSTLIDAGDPAGGAGNDIGAVGAGTANANDKFGLP